MWCITARGFTYTRVRGDRSRVARWLTHTPFFLEDFLSGGDNGRDRLIVARYGLGWLGGLLARSAKSRTIFSRKSGDGSKSISGLKMGDFQEISKDKPRRY